MAAEEEQTMELEALRSIFMDEYKPISDDYPAKFEINIVPYQSNEQPNHVKIVLSVSFTPEYPNQLPELAFKHSEALSLTQLKQLKAIMDEKAAESLGMAMVFTIVEAIREYLIENNKPELNMHEEMMARLQKSQNADEAEGSEEEEEDEDAEEENDGTEVKDVRKVFATHTVVTADSFARWREKFEAEQKANGTFLRQKDPTKLSGRQLFERDHSLAMSDATYLEESDNVIAAEEYPHEEPAEGEKKELFYYNEQLYDDVDLEVDSDEDGQ
eukprot:GILK01003344.1.p1 GENE.GILK01003344.1~~GILK01003344.1.p1  ORF type:complete len:272 (-),score=67.99 GILK01003344.1:98-913(-)